MRYLSVCSGIEAATVAWHHMGWEPAGFSEIEKFPSQVLEHHYPNVPKLGDMTKYKEWNIGAIDLLVGGTPCQSFSVAGLRKGLEDPRGNLALVYCGILDHFRPKWFVWENVPGVLSSAGGRDFGSFLGALAQLGYGFAYRVLDAQYFGVAQRRRRVFVVGYLGDWRPAAAVLFERESLRRDSAPSREKRQATSSSIAASAGSQHEDERVIGALTAKGPCAMGAPEVDGGHYLPMCFQQNTRDEVRYLGGDGQIAGALAAEAGMKQQNYIQQPISIQGNLIGREAGGPQGVGASDEGVMYTLTKADVHGVAQAIPLNSMTMQGRPSDNGRMGFGIGQPGDPCPTITKAHSHAVAQPINIYGGNKRPDRPEGGFYVRMDEDTSKTLDAATGLNPTCSQGGTAVMQPVAVDVYNQSIDGQTAATLTEACGGTNTSGPKVMQPVGSLCARTGLSISVQDAAQGHLRTESMAVRRLTPVECERLQGFPDGYTDIKPKGKETPDGPRYKALGNSMAVPVMRWIGERIANVEG